MVRNTPAWTEATCCFPTRHFAQSTPPSKCPKATDPAAGTSSPQSAHRSSDGSSPRIRSKPSSNRSTCFGGRLAVGQGRKRLVGQVEQFRMGVVVVGQRVEQFGDVVAAVQSAKLPG